MDTVPRRRPWAFVIYGLLVVCVVPVVSSTIAASRPPACAALREWADQYKDAAPTLDTLAMFDRAHRLAIFNAVTPAVRATLMREHLDRWSQQPGLSSEQRNLLTEGKQLLAPALYSRRDGPEHQAFMQFWSRAAPAFPSIHDKLPWFDLVTPAKRAGPRIAATANISDLCDCNANHPWPQCSGGCIFGGCDDADWGCGPAMAYPCNGMCASLDYISTRSPN